MTDMPKTVNDFPKLGIVTQDLIDAVNAALAEAGEARDAGESFGAVNWGDLGIADIEYRLSMLTPQDGPQCTVIVGEASPDCKLPGWLYDRLKDRFPCVSVECEW